MPPKKWAVDFVNGSAWQLCRVCPRCGGSGRKELPGQHDKPLPTRDRVACSCTGGMQVLRFDSTGDLKRFVDGVTD